MKIRTDLLRKLANHLYNPRTRTHRRHLKTFRFDRVAIHTDCGTAGCAMGELPYCFPKQWQTRGKLLGDDARADLELYPVLMDWPIESSAGSAAAKFFGISYRTSISLFYSKDQSAVGILPRDATAKQVAAHLRAYCSRVEARRVGAKK